MTTGVYLHVPFRRAGHRHDDAYAVPYTPDDGATYVEAVCAEIELYADRIESWTVDTLYVGGGCPSLLPATALATICEALMHHADARSIEETTMEAAPADGGTKHNLFCCNNGFIRVSLAVLAWSAEILTTVGATHSAKDARAAVERVQSSALDSFSIDLLFGVPGQTRSTWIDTLHRTVDLGVPHITLQEWTESEPEHAAHLYRRAHEHLQDAGYTAYELTHYARPNHASVHEQRFLAHGTLLGLGPSAHTFWWPPPHSTTEATRWHNVADLHAYADAIAQGTRPLDGTATTLSAHQCAQEYVDRALRTAEGLDLDALRHDTGLDLPAASAQRVSRLADAGLVIVDDSTISLTLDGRLQLDALVPFLLPG